jgi:nitrate/nitrite-specific signal transduction histidine kinase
MFVITIRILNNGGNNYMDRDLMAIFDWALPILFSLVGIITWLKSLAIHAPITEYQEEACKIGEGHFDTRIMVRSADEIGALGGTLNDMARGLEERERMRSIFKADNVRK